MSETQQGPSRAGYVIALIVFAVGSIIAIALLAYMIINILRLDGELDRIIVPGATELELEDTGRYTVFYEYRTTVEGQHLRSDDSPPNLSISVRSVDTGEPVPVSSAFGNANYTFWGSSGESIASFRIEEPGTYEISAQYVDTTNGQDLVLALGEGIGTTILLSVGAALTAGIIFTICFVIAVILAIVTLVRRSRNDQSPGYPTYRSTSNQPPGEQPPTS